MDRNDTSLSDKYGERLDDDERAQNSQQDFGSLPSMNVKSVKKEWTAVNVYIPNTLLEELNEQYRDLRYESGDSLKKGRHYYPLLVAHGLDQLDGKDVDGLAEDLEELQKRINEDL